MKRERNKLGISVPPEKVVQGNIRGNVKAASTSSEAKNGGDGKKGGKPQERKGDYTSGNERTSLQQITLSLQKKDETKKGGEKENRFANVNEITSWG